MPYTVEILRRAEKALRDLADRKLYRRLREAIDALAASPHSGLPSSAAADSRHLHFVAVQVSALAVLAHRILYQVIDDRLLVLVVDLGHRREIYRG